MLLLCLCQLGIFGQQFSTISDNKIFFYHKIIMLIFKSTKSTQKQMFFIAFDQVQRSQQSKFSAFRDKLTFSFKLLFFVSLGFLLYNQISLNGLFFANIPTKTFANMQIWRIFTAPFATLDGLYGLVSLVVGFWWLVSLFPGYEKRYSSIHLLVQVFVQNFLVQIIYCMVVTLLVRNTYFYETYNDYFFSIGWMPMVIVWMFKFTGQNLQEKINFCFMPFLIKNKYLAWVISVIMIILTIQRLPLFIATLVAWVQFHLCHCSINRLPFFFYVVLEKVFCICTRFCVSYVKVADVQHNLSIFCGGKSQSLLNLQEQSNMNKEQDSKNMELQPMQNINSGQKKQSEFQLQSQLKNQDQSQIQ